MAPVVVFSTNTRSSPRAPRNPATSAAAARIRGGSARGPPTLTLVSSRSMKRAGWRSISSWSARCAASTRRGVAPTVPWFR